MEHRVRYTVDRCVMCDNDRGRLQLAIDPGNRIETLAPVWYRAHCSLIAEQHHPAV